MTKKKKTTSKKSKESWMQKFKIENYIPQKHQTWVATLIILILLMLFFFPLFFGNKTFQSGDIIQMKSMRAYINKDRDSFSLWNPYIFCGIPAYATSTTTRWFDLTGLIYSKIKIIYASLFSSEYVIHTFNFLMLGIFSFLLMRYLKGGFLISLLVSLATVFSTGILVMLTIGHITKLMSVAVFPLIFLLILKFQKQIKLFDILILIVALHMLVLGAHVQMIFYMFFAILIYFIYYFIYAFQKKDTLLKKQLLKTAGVLVLGAAIALAMSYDKYAQLYEYKPYSTRGAKSIVEKENSKKSESDFYNYATNWSFSPGEVLTFVIPSYYGFGKSTYKGPLTQNRPVEVNTYFGQMPFVDVAMYMGVIIFFLALFGILSNWKNPFVQYLSYLSGIALLISFGRTFPPFYDLMFYYFPLFDNFRVPSMILILLQISFPILAGFGLLKIIELRHENNDRLINILKYTTLAFAGLLVLALLFNSAFSDLIVSRLNNYISEISRSRPQLSQQFKALTDYIRKMFMGDVYLAFLFVSLTFGAAYLYVKNSISKDLMLAFILILVVIDLWRIDKRGTIYTDDSNINREFSTPNYVKVIKSRKDKYPFRILNLKQDGSLGSISHSGNFNVYFLLEDFYGYSAIKPRSYQDLMDVIGPANPTLWKMLNVKYLIANQPLNFPGLSLLSSKQKEYIYLNTLALPRFYFIDTIKTMKPLEGLKAIKNNSFDPAKTGFIEQGNLTVNKPDSNAKVDLKVYKDELIELNVSNANNNSMLFFGDTFYPVGWHAFVDKNEVKIHKINHGFMGIVVPSGIHKVIFKYAPKSFYIGKYASLTLNSLVWLGILLSLFQFYKKKKPSNVNQ